MSRYDVAVVGAGIAGLAHAWMAARRGLKVLLLERSTRAQGATVRNFGMILPVAQPAGDLYELALRSREYWLELHRENVLSVERCGSILLAHHADELAVLEEFVARKTHSVEMLSADELCRRSSMAASQGLLGGMASAMELRVDPRTAAAKIANWLGNQPNVDLAFETCVTRAEAGRIESSDGRVWQTNRMVICSGSDLRTLYPHAFRQSGLRLCKLQMLQTHSRPQPTAPRPHLVSGLSLRHYDSFEGCPSLAGLKHRIAEQFPELNRYGIHVMASIFPDGRVVLGDSHVFGDEITPFDQPCIDDLIVRELRKILQLEDWTITERWHGIYAKHDQRPVFAASLPEGVQIFVGVGGAGMTLAFGLADQAWDQWVGPVQSEGVRPLLR